MKSWQIRIVVTLYFLGVFFTNKPKLLIYGWIMTGLLFLAFILDMDRVRKFDFKENVFGNRMLLLALVGFFSVAWAPDPERSLWHIEVILVSIAASFVLYYFFVTYELLNLFVYVFLFYSFVNYSLALKLPYFHFLLNLHESYRFIGTELNPNGLAVALISSMFLSFWYLQERVKRSSAIVIVHLVSIILAVYTIILTASRKGILFGSLLIILFLVLNYSKWIWIIKRYYIYISILTIVISIMNFEGIKKNIEKPLDRFISLFETVKGGAEEGSSNARVRFVKNGWKGFKEQPWIGHGADSFRYYNVLYAHNNYIELLFDLGIIGPIIYYSIHFQIIRRLFRFRTGMFISAFVFVLMLMDVAYVSYSEKRNMMILVVVIVAVKKKIEELQLDGFLEIQDSEIYNSEKKVEPSGIDFSRGLV